MKGIPLSNALKLIEIEEKSKLFKLFEKASSVRERFSGRTVATCSIINAKCGKCPEDCAFCAQSVFSKSKIETYPLISSDDILKGAYLAAKNGSSHFGIVTSGRSINSKKELDVICEAIRKICEKTKIIPCASLGCLEKESMVKLKEAGLARYHHNLETSRSFFNKICTTRNYDEQVNTVQNAKSAGLSVCSGGIFGLGESRAQRVELLETLRKLDVDSIPINFLNPIKGTRLEKLNELTPYECLKIIAVARLMIPDKRIRICGGRECNLRDFQSWIFFAGADALMTGNYLVTSGRSVQSDLQMLEDAEMKLVLDKTDKT